MKVVKLIGKNYEVNELEENSKIVRKWLVIKKLKKEEIRGKYHNIENFEEINKVFDKMINELDAETKNFFKKYINENWKETFPIMKDVSAYAKVRPEDGTEFCILI